MRRLLAIWFLTTYSWAILRPVVPVVDYFVRYDLFANVLCENKERPELNCDGKCILMQRIKASSQEETQPTPAASSLAKWKEVSFGIWCKQEVLFQAFCQRWSPVFHLSGNLCAGMLRSVFHPPLL